MSNAQNKLESKYYGDLNLHSLKDLFEEKQITYNFLNLDLGGYYQDAHINTKSLRIYVFYYVNVI